LNGHAPQKPSAVALYNHLNSSREWNRYDYSKKGLEETAEKNYSIKILQIFSNLQIFFKCSKIIVNPVLAFLISALPRPQDFGEAAFGFLSFMAGRFPLREGIFHKCKPVT